MAIKLTHIEARYVTEAMRIDNPLTEHVLDVTEVRKTAARVTVIGRTNSGGTQSFTVPATWLITRWVRV